MLSKGVLRPFLGSGDSPKFVVCDDDGRAIVTPYRAMSIDSWLPVSTADGLCRQVSIVGDLANSIVRSTDGSEVREGPYKIASVPSVGKYTLCLLTGQPVKNGTDFEEKDLEPLSGL
jgi:hypothetical protein